MRQKSVVLLLFAQLLVVGNASAQDKAQDQKKESRWGVTGSATPSWQSADQLITKFVDVDRFDVHGSEFQAGFVRGSIRGGDWGASFVRKNISNSSRVFRIDDARCMSVNAVSQCYQNDSTYSFSGASLYGVEAHVYKPFATIANRVQIGVNLAGGVGKFGGTTTRDQLVNNYTWDGTRFVGAPTRKSTTTGVSEFVAERGGPKTLPLVRTELAVATIVSQSFKLKFSGGFSFPGYQRFAISAVYFP